MQEKKYGLTTAITMITGIVIGSGIFFKSDDVLSYTNGNMVLGIVVFIIAAFAIIFGSLTISTLAAKTDSPGGIIGYVEQFISKKAASAFGWFQMILYFAPIIAVVAWATGLYLCQLFQIEATPLISNLVGGITLLVIFLINALSAALGGLFQNAAMLIKLIPLAIIAFAGLFFGNPAQIIANDIQAMPQTIQSSSWIAALVPIAFSFDGWSIATTICHEIKNSKRNLPIALIVAPIIVLSCYLLYFVGITSLVGVDTVMKQGNESVYTAANQVFGAIGAKLILVFVIISILGTLNGLTLAFIQLPYSLAIRNMLPGSKQLTKISKSFGNMPVYSALFALVLSFIWLGINYLTQKASMIGDISDVPIGLSYVMFILLYLTVIRLGRKGEVKGKFMAYIAPSLAIVGSLIIVAGTVTHSTFWFFIVIAVAICGLGYYYGARATKTVS